MKKAFYKPQQLADVDWIQTNDGKDAIPFRSGGPNGDIIPLDNPKSKAIREYLKKLAMEDSNKQPKRGRIYTIEKNKLYLASYRKEYITEWNWLSFIRWKRNYSHSNQRLHEHKMTPAINLNPFIPQKYVGFHQRQLILATTSFPNISSSPKSRVRRLLRVTPIKSNWP